MSTADAEGTLDTRCSVPLLTMVLTGPRFSANDRLHHRKRDELVQDWRNLGQQHAQKEMGWQPLKLALAHVFVFVRPGTAGRFDPGNVTPAAKAAIDGMVRAGLFVDDDAKHLIGPDYRPGRVGRRPEGCWVLRFDVWVPPGAVAPAVLKAMKR